MRKKITNKLKITCNDVDLLTLKKIEFYVKQLSFCETYTPEVISSSEMLVTIPYEDACKLVCCEVKLQFAFTDKDGNDDASDVVTMHVQDLLKEVGYAPI